MATIAIHDSIIIVTISIFIRNMSKQVVGLSIQTQSEEQSEWFQAAEKKEEKKKKSNPLSVSQNFTTSVTKVKGRGAKKCVICKLLVACRNLFINKKHGLFCLL